MTPDEFTNQEFQLPVGDGHELYVHDWGNPKAKTPIVSLHGGPGSGSKDSHKQRFDPRVQRVIFHDQRGAGRSTPYGSLEHNTTLDLVEDIEKIAEKLNLTKFILVGSSWGSTLALAYALQHPKRIKVLVISGVFTASAQELQYLDYGLYRTHFPDVWQAYLDATPPEHHADPTAYHVARILGDDKAAAIASARAYGAHEYHVMSLDDRTSPDTTPDEDYDLAKTKLGVHYLSNGCFLDDRTILDSARAIKTPTWIVQGRYDFVCPPITAWQLHQALPKSQLIWTQAGHGADRSNYETIRTLLLSLGENV